MLPAAASLKKQGANNGATTAFLISTPESGVDSIAVSYALLDPIMTIMRPLAAFVTATLAGFLENIISYKRQAPAIQMFSEVEETEECCSDPACGSTNRSGDTLRHKLVEGIRFALFDVWADIALWFFAGVILAGSITALVPTGIIENWLGGGIESLLLMLVFGIPLYICATASTPIAAALILKGVSPGAALVFLLTGPATNITSLSVLLKILGKKGTIRYLISIAVMAVIFGLLTDSIYSSLGISPRAIIGTAAKIVPDTVQITCAIILVLLTYNPLFTYLNITFKKKKR
ncbi:hypothetical membrane protein [Desulfotalea psychrophila LSv54]|uniref:Hypothetical membrane protein n=1 Tax=Desulfotalea psychrophila (strain LSv54 / DSM 12343) TaxID=177439 RepID=Q6AS12_DESPS|nr:hypothetical membrane protein [Desulfotalea psychrophila LSv54]